MCVCVFFFSNSYTIETMNLRLYITKYFEKSIHVFIVVHHEDVFKCLLPGVAHVNMTQFFWERGCEPPRQLENIIVQISVVRVQNFHLFICCLHNCRMTVAH